MGEDAILYKYFFSSLKPPEFPAFAASLVKSSIKSLRVTLAPRVKVREAALNVQRYRFIK